jgi:hypothetical protein
MPVTGRGVMRRQGGCKLYMLAVLPPPPAQEDTLYLFLVRG